MRNYFPKIRKAGTIHQICLDIISDLDAGEEVEVTMEQPEYISVILNQLSNLNYSVIYSAIKDMDEIQFEFSWLQDDITKKPLIMFPGKFHGYKLWKSNQTDNVYADDL